MELQHSKLAESIAFKIDSNGAVDLYKQTLQAINMHPFTRELSDVSKQLLACHGAAVVECTGLGVHIAQDTSDAVLIVVNSQGHRLVYNVAHIVRYATPMLVI